jgi:protein-disulfide isomerase
MDPTPFPSDPLPAPRQQPYFILIPLALILGMFLGYYIRGAGVAARVTQQPPTAEAAAQVDPQAAAIATGVAATITAEQAQAQQVTRYEVPIDDDPVLGPNDAAITIIEFSDYECPYCKRWHDETFDRLLEAFPGQIRFVYRDFPLTSIHANAAPAAEAANCAHEQNRFWDFHRKLFSSSTLNTQTYLNYASELGLDMATFEECVSSRRHQDEVMADLEWAVNLGISSTPTFFVNGIALVGAQPFEMFSDVISKELAGEIP